MQPTPPPTKRKTPLLPDGDRQLAALALLASQYWNKNSWLTLRYTDAKRFDKTATDYEKAVTSRQQMGTTRPIEADELLDLDHTIDTTLYRVKDALTSQYDRKSAPAHYPMLGISKYKGNYLIDRERTKRAAALKVLLTGLVTEKIDAGPYGTTFWQPIADRYNVLVTQLADTTGDISQAVAHKDTQRDLVEQVLSSLAKVLDANYPNDAEYRAELRAAGFQRESY